MLEQQAHEGVQLHGSPLHMEQRKQPIREIEDDQGDDNSRYTLRQRPRERIGRAGVHKLGRAIHVPYSNPFASLMS